MTTDVAVDSEPSEAVAVTIFVTLRPVAVELEDLVLFEYVPLPNVGRAVTDGAVVEFARVVELADCAAARAGRRRAERRVNEYCILVLLRF